MDTAWKLILSGRSSCPNALRTVFADSDDGDYIDSRQFSEIHKVVLGLGSIALEQLTDLLEFTDINAVDTLGRTSLAWASAGNNRPAVSTLLCHGADPNIGNHCWETPIMHTTDPGCVGLLLDAGANINARDRFDRVPLSHATAEVRCAKLILDRGADINPIGGLRQDTPLHHCVINRFPETLRFLLECGADYSIPAMDNSSIVHVALKIGDAKTLRALSQANLSGLGPDTMNSAGETVFTLAEQQKRLAPQLRSAIDELVASLQPAIDLEVWYPAVADMEEVEADDPRE